MKVTKTMKNSEIYTTAENLLMAFPQGEEGKFPVKALFLLRKNIKSFVDLAQEIEKARTEIIQKYGKPSEADPDKFEFEGENIELVNKDLGELVDCEQEVSYYTFSLDSLGNVELTNAQMDAIIDFIEYEGE